ncbi:MAG TPA: dipeptide epimerase, partial [Bacteroidia bacterium]|nr:dipeptide epimerase [Bacteroidia bacterium]
MKFRYTPHTLYFKHPFKIAHGTRSSTPIVITELEHEGKTGYGEASMPPYLGESHDTVLAFLEKVKPILLSSPPLEIETIMKKVDALAQGNTAAKASIDIALHDLKGKLLNKACWKLMGADPSKTPYTTFTLGIDKPEIMVEKIKEAQNYKVLKVKLNGIDDKTIIDTIRTHTDKPIAVDVNQGWKSKEQALEMINWLAGQKVIFVEQPLAKNALKDMQWLFERSPLHLFADESIQRYEDIDKVKNCFHGINIKLMKCTGMLEAYKMIRHAREVGLRILMGCMSETSCAISAAAQLTPFVDYADLDGCLLMKNDFFKGIEFIDGKITLNELPGNGVVLKKIDV